MKYIDQEIQEYTLKNGLKVYLVASDKTEDYLISYCVKYGSHDIEFIPINEKEFIKTPKGIAHFLEHKLFEDKDGVSAFEFASSHGSSINAGTSTNSTTYYIGGSTNFIEDLDFLTNLLINPYFTEENIKKEVGIISEEINMYADEPMSKLEDQVQNNLYNTSPYKYKISGEIEDIKSITKEDLYTCYNTFYNPNNMILIITGNFNKKEAINYLENNKNLNNLKSYEVIRKTYNEDPNVNEEFQYMYEDITIPKSWLSVKINIKNINIDKKILKYLLTIILHNNYSSTSILYEKLETEEIVSDFYYDFDIKEDYLILDFVAESKYSDIFRDEILNSFNNLKLDNKSLTRIKNLFISNEVKNNDYHTRIGSMIKRNYIDFNNIEFNDLEIINNIKLTDINNLIKKLDFNNYLFILMLPKE